MVERVDRSSNGESSTTSDQRPPAVEEPQNAVELVRDLVQPLEQLGVIDLEDRRQRRELLAEAPPLVDPPHPLHEDALRGTADDVLVRDGAELDLERGLVPDERAVDGLLAAEAAELGVDHLAVAEVDVPLLAAAAKVNDAALPRYLEGLEQIDHGHVRRRPGEARPPRRGAARGGDVLLRPAREEQVHPRDELADEDRLRQVVLDPELEAANLVLDRLLAREKDDGDARPLRRSFSLRTRVYPSSLGRRVSLRTRSGVERFDLRERVQAVGGRGDAVAGLLEAHLEHADAPRIGVDEKQLLLGHGRSVSMEGGAAGVKPGESPAALGQIAAPA